MNLQNIVLGEISHSKEDNIIQVPLYEVPRVVKCIETVGWMVIARDWEEGRRGRSVFNGLQFRKRRKLCRWMVVVLCRVMWIYLMLQTINLKMVKMVNLKSCQKIKNQRNPKNQTQKLKNIAVLSSRDTHQQLWTYQWLLLNISVWYVV